MQYYILVGVEQRGPFAWDELRGQPLTADTQVWHEGLADWKPASLVPELGPLLQPTVAAAGESLSEIYVPPMSVERRRHARFGIASFIGSLLSGFTLLALIVTFGVLESSHPEGVDEEAPAMIALGLGILAALGGHFIGLGLGLAGLFEGDRYKVFAILGLCFNTLALLVVGGLMVIGMQVD